MASPPSTEVNAQGVGTGTCSDRTSPYVALPPSCFWRAIFWRYEPTYDYGTYLVVTTTFFWLRLYWSCLASPEGRQHTWQLRTSPYVALS